MRAAISPILNSSLDIMQHAIEHLQGGTERDLKFAVQHADNALELLLKELCRFKGIRVIDKQGQSISYYDCVNKLQAAGLEIPELTDIDLLHVERNLIYHLGSQPDKKKTEWLVYDVALNFVKRVCREELGGYDIAKYSKVFELPLKIEQEIEATSSEIVNRYLFETMSSLQSNAYNATIILAFSGIEALLRESLSFERRSHIDFVRKLVSERIFSEELTKEIEALRQLRNATIHDLSKATKEQAAFALEVFRKAIDEIGLPLEVKCKTCQVQFKSGIVMSQKSFKTAELVANVHRCPNGHIHSYSKEDYIVRL